MAPPGAAGGGGCRDRGDAQRREEHAPRRAQRRKAQGARRRGVEKWANGSAATVREGKRGGGRGRISELGAAPPRAQIASYPFTTLVPNLGVCEQARGPAHP